MVDERFFLPADIPPAERARLLAEHDRALAEARQAAARLCSRLALMGRDPTDFIVSGDGRTRMVRIRWDPGEPDQPELLRWLPLEWDALNWEPLASFSTKIVLASEAELRGALDDPARIFSS